MYLPGSIRPYLLVLTAAFLWGTIGVVGKVLYDLGQISALSLGLFRLGVAAPLLGLLSWRLDRGTPWRFGRGERRWWLLAMTSMGAYQIFLFNAVQRTDVTTAIFLAICTAPILVALAAPFLLGERLTRTTLAAGALALVGTTLLLGLSAPGAMLASTKLLGNLLALGAAVCWAAYAIVARRLVQDYRPTRITFFTFAGAALMVAPLVIWQDQPLSLPPLGWALAIYLGVFPTALAYFLYVRGLRTVGATTSSFLALAEPATAAVLAAVLFDEHLSAGGWLGVSLLLAGLVLLISGSRRR